MYRHILIATDGSALAERAVSHGLSLAKSVGAKVIALTVEAPFNVYDVPESRVRQMSEAFAQHAEQARQHAAGVLDRVAEAAKASWCPLRDSTGRACPPLPSDHHDRKGQGLRCHRHGLARAERDFRGSAWERDQ